MRIKCTEAVLSAFDKQRSFFTLEGHRRWRPGDEIEVDPSFILESYTVVVSDYHIPSMGCFSYSWTPLPTDTKIGRYCSISWNVSVISGVVHPFDFLTTSSITYDRNFVIFKKAMEDFSEVEIKRYDLPQGRPGRDKAPEIGHDVWIGHDVVLGRGISLGHGCVVAAHAVVTKSVPPYAVVGGNPARIIRMRFDEKTVERLLAIEWWNYNFIDFGALRYDQVHVCLDEIETLIADRKSEEFRPAALTADQLLNLSMLETEAS